MAIPSHPSFHARLLRTAAISACCCVLLACASAPKPTAATPHSQLVYGPYKHLNMAVNPQNPVATTQVLGTPQVLAGTPRAVLMPGAQALTLAFASGECGQERWGDLSAQAVAHANVDTLTRAALPHIISTGGEGSIFTCGSNAAMEQFVARYE